MQKVLITPYAAHMLEMSSHAASCSHFKNKISRAVSCSHFYDLKQLVHVYKFSLAPPHYLQKANLETIAVLLCHENFVFEANGLLVLENTRLCLQQPPSLAGAKNRGGSGYGSSSSSDLR